jgi:hypothetical protein
MSREEFLGTDSPAAFTLQFSDPQATLPGGNDDP